MNEPIHFADTARDRQNVTRYIRFCALWAVVFVGSTFALQFEYVESLPLRWLLAFVPSAFALLTVRAYWRYLNEMDELLRAIEIKALARSVAAGFVVWPAAMLVEVAASLDIHVPITMLVITGVYAFGSVKGRMDYR